MPCHTGLSRWMANMSQQGGQQGGGGVMFWDGIKRCEMLGLFRLSDEVNMTSAKYVQFLTGHFLAWYERKNHAFIL